MTRARLARISWFPVLALTLAAWVASPPDATAQQQSSRDQPFFGVTTDGNLIPDLFPIRATGVSTAPIVEAAKAYLRMLRPDRTRAKAASRWGSLMSLNDSPCRGRPPTGTLLQ